MLGTGELSLIGGMCCMLLWLWFVQKQHPMRSPAGG